MPIHLSCSPCLSRWFARRLQTLVYLLLYCLAGAVVYRFLGVADAFPAAIWLPSGVALAACLWFGSRMWLAVFAGSLIVNYGLFDAPLDSALGLSASNTLGPVLAAALYRHQQADRLPFYRIVDTVRFLVLGVGVSSTLSALGGALLFDQLHHTTGQEGFMPFVRWWLCDAAGALVLTPILLLCLSREQDHYRRHQAALPESLTVALGTLCAAGWMFLSLPQAGQAYPALPALLLLPLLGMVGRVPLRAAHGLALGVATLALAGAASGRGVFSPWGTAQALGNTSMTLMAQSITLLVIGALVAERRISEERLRQANQTLERKVRERTQQLLDSEARFRLMADAAPFPLVMNTLSDGRLLYANPKAEALFRSTLGQTPLNVLDFYVCQEERSAVVETLLRAGAIADREVRLRDSDGRTFWAHVSCSLVRTEQAVYVISGINDVTERKALEYSLQTANEALRRQVNEIESLQHGLREQAVRDPLTGLFNRRYLDDTLPRVLAHMRALDRPVAVLMLDADHFKRINDTWGHKSGDAVLAAIGRYLAQRFRTSDIVCRYGGEEFLIVMPDSDPVAAENKARTLCRELRRLPIDTAGQTLHVTLSIGVAFAPTHGEEAEAVVQAADLALYAAKRAGRDCVVVAGTAACQPSV